MTNRTIDSFFKKRRLEPSGSGETPCPLCDSSPKHQTKKSCRAESLEFDISSIERDPGKRKSIWEYLEHQRDEVRRAYIKFGPYQPELPIESMVVDKKGQRFLFSWYIVSRLVGIFSNKECCLLSSLLTFFQANGPFWINGLHN